MIRAAADLLGLSVGRLVAGAMGFAVLTAAAGWVVHTLKDQGRQEALQGIKDAHDKAARKADRRWTAAIATAVTGIALSGCVGTPHPTLSPCGIFEDSLGDVIALTADGNRRISAHFERGIAAGCWDRSAALPD